MTPLDLDELERLEAAATPGPWTATTDDCGFNVIIPPGEMDRPEMCREWIFQAMKDHAEPDDHHFVVALRNAFPALLRELRARRRQVKILDAALCNIQAGFPGPERRIAEAALEEYAALEPAAPAKGGEGET